MDWFKHDIDAQRDIKIRKLIRKHGYEGYGLYWHVVELLYGAGGKISKRDLIEELEVIDSDGFLNELIEIGLVEENDNQDVSCSRIMSEMERQAEIAKARAEAGKRGLEARWGNSKSIANDSKNIAIATDLIANDSKGIADKIREEENIKKENTLKGIKERSSRFSPPTVEEVRTYCSERNNDVDAERFVNFYASKGWKVGQTPMKDWKAAVRTWERKSDNSIQRKKIEENIDKRNSYVNSDGSLNLL